MARLKTIQEVEYFYVPMPTVVEAQKLGSSRGCWQLNLHMLSSYLSSTRTNNQQHQHAANARVPPAAFNNYAFGTASLTVDNIVPLLKNEHSTMQASSVVGDSDDGCCSSSGRKWCGSGPGWLAEQAATRHCSRQKKKTRREDEEEEGVNVNECLKPRCRVS